MKTLRIKWQRLVDEQGQTCDRCGSTETAVENALRKLKSSMYPLGIDVLLEKEALSPSAFSRAPLESNRVWISERPIEEWLSATSGKSQCCAACGDSECRTLTVDGKTYEAIPAELIIKAGLLAASQLLEGAEPAPCCQPAESSESGAVFAHHLCNSVETKSSFQISLY
jgi:hypothetical protein